ncbi:hypothetical protein MAC_05745 [Metarhizium acridum CQMa 102]|uniref:CsbD-like domain-containing protein n=1 Tax=Metarhizium acridum (strain CQMa 102) TaxID=655827 RepID=E9E797_METAQ|nr:uncharacterized protein MAC_05745 [Metarhizium acridum CQMa 102]EFY88272.1 hypothetical protein MAC_05745 [Metarhizium acridum CQMa 102]
MAEDTPQQPSLVQGHVKYVKGVAEAAVGDMTGSHPWKSSGEQDKAAGMSAMKEAGEKRDASQGYGKPEELVGKLTGCEGMKKEGSKSSSSRKD